MLLPLLLSLALQGSQDTWSGLEVSKVYTTGHSPAVLLGFDIDTRRALLAGKSQTGATLGTSVGYIAGASNVRPLEGVFAADIIWDASRGTVLTGQSLLMIEGARVSLDDGYEFSVSSTHSLVDLLAEFPDDQVEEAEATAIGLEPMGMYGKNDRYGRIGPSQSLLVLPHGRQVVYASGENRVTRAWVIPGKDGGLHSFKWEDPSLGISRGESYTYFRMRSDDNFAVRSRHLAQVFRLFRPDNSQRGQETNRLWEARKGQLLAWSQEQRDKAARYWNGW